MTPYADAGLLEPVDFLFAQYGWSEALPSQLLPLLRRGGNLYAAPLAIHRTNVLWYHPRPLAQNGIAPPTTQAEFLAALAALKAAGMEAPLALAEPWTATHLFETLLLAALGPAAYAGLWTGATDWNAPEVTAAIEQFAALLTFSNADAAGLTWEQAAQRLSDGQAAFLVMGDWADGFFRRQGLRPGEDYAWRPAPGTDGAFQFLVDGFVLPVGAPHRAAAVAWLRLAGSKAGQDAYNSIAGSIPARRDADRRRYSPYQQEAMSDWAADALVGSLTHGVVTTANWQAEITHALEQFQLSQDVAILQATLAGACSHAGACP
jgi:glucose/mannose transport system substrate-binding protein